MPTATSQQVLSIGAAAQKLGATELEVRRLIARGQLKATQITEGVVRLLDGEVANFVATGAQDFKKLPRNAPWFQEKWGPLINDFEQRIRSLANRPGLRVQSGISGMEEGAGVPWRATDS